MTLNKFLFGVFLVSAFFLALALDNFLTYCATTVDC